MATADQIPPSSNRDLASMADARAAVLRAKAAAPVLAELSQEQIDAIVSHVADTAAAHAEPLATMAVEETGFGIVADKVRKNLFASRRVLEFIRPMKTVGVIARHDDRRVVEIAEPFGVVAAIIPSTNPTSTAIYKILIALKARCPLVLSPHPSAVRCITRVAELLDEAARRAGAPAGAISWMSTVTLEGTQELMKHRDVAVILATGGMGLVRAAYSAGKPAYGVGPGNAPAYIERSADVRKAVEDIITGKTFDNGVLCSSENSVVVDEAIAADAMREFQAQGGHFLTPNEMSALAKVLVTPQRLPNPELVGRSAQVIAERCGIQVAPGTRVLLAPLNGVGRDFPLSIEKLCPVLSFYVVSDWREGCERCKQILRYGGMGHTMSIHSKDDRVILEFGLKKPAFRIVVNSPTTLGSIGLTTGLDPAMMLGCGGWGGNITSDNITPRHLLNVKRLAYELRPAKQALAPASPPRPSGPPTTRIDPAALSRRIESFLGSRGYKGDAAGGDSVGANGAASPGGVLPHPPTGETERATRPAQTPPPRPEVRRLEFVSEEDVRAAIRAGATIELTGRAIVTPSARDLAEQHHVFGPGNDR